MWPFTERQPPQKRHHIGYVQFKYVNPETKVPHTHYTAQLYAYGDDLKKREVMVNGNKPDHGAESHGFYQTTIVPWLEGGNLWMIPKMEPSDWFREWTKSKNGYEYIEGEWVKPAPKYEGDADVIRPDAWHGNKK